MCYYTFLNEKLLQRYTFFMIYAYKTSKFAKKNLIKLSYFAIFSN